MAEIIYSPNTFNYGTKKQYKRFFVLLALLALIIFTLIKLGLGVKEIIVGRTNNILDKKVLPISEEELGKYVMPKKEQSRLDILVMGIRGKDDPDPANTGIYLTDSMMIFSYDKETGKSSLVSVPRDFYVLVDKNKKDKINTVYEVGFSKKNGLDYAKKLFSEISGVYVDHIIVFDFSAFEKIVDQLGGVDITLAKPFEEDNQWGYSFSLPAGQNHLDGKTALYYVRSRYSTSDFDRSYRQQQIIMAIKSKLLGLNIFNEPGRALDILNTIRKNIDTDADIFDMAALGTLAKEINASATGMKRYVISTDNLVYETHENGIYILLPKGDNFDGIKKLFQDILTSPLISPSSGLAPVKNPL
ncbi:MAG: hypothetical protein A2750_03640 [Candidatus Yanofskybacteria bacterium RIFCSPHIGHO2_01_FULL_45_42]|nr:MAG: hypothetical protein A2750_03640 [Candidatus Yanofskybacteria bacterium RIFCSPHIGHO2_01_FULL_45_42]OGN16877.1 MAG: hypothetical protein A3C81_03190 [Candidatus Yanofskybacteria bacterium RIFCSPHIGHO2_02_FULL_46_19]OGN27564.1 MAG: hypothetical protein A3B17_00840 [Candidatus Yanofskybacteria bacterium RIFCSPLOWO2_01_FULL_45_72]